VIIRASDKFKPAVWRGVAEEKDPEVAVKDDLRGGEE
jgi:hypothetical protein